MSHGRGIAFVNTQSCLNPVFFTLVVILCFIAFQSKRSLRIDTTINTLNTSNGVNGVSVIRLSDLINHGNSWTRTLLKQNQRSVTLKNSCGNRPNRKPFVLTSLRRLIVDEQHKLVYCLVPKAGCTNWKRMLLNISSGGKIPNVFIHNTTLLKQYGYRSLADYPKQNRSQILDTYTKMILVRNPFYRMLSAYRNKITLSTYSYIFQRIVAKFREGGDNSLPATFQEFLQYVTSLKRRSAVMDQHWASYERLCNPCDINYTVIVKTESLDSDVQYMRNMFYNGSQNAIIGRKWSDATNSTILSDMYSAVEPKIIQGFIEAYQYDFEMFGYSKNLERDRKIQ